MVLPISLKMLSSGERGFVDTAGRERFFHGANVVVKGPPWLPATDRRSAVIEATCSSGASKNDSWSTPGRSQEVSIIMCFRCARLGHSREECRQPAVACSRCGGDHSESLHAKSDLTFGQRRALLNDAKGRQNPRAASAIPMSVGGESIPELTGQAHGLDIEDHEEDESGAFVTFAPALPVSSVVYADPSASVVYADPSNIGVIGIAGHLADLVRGR
jgi:hypothetical protein